MNWIFTLKNITMSSQIYSLEAAFIYISFTHWSHHISNKRYSLSAIALSTPPLLPFWNIHTFIFYVSISRSNSSSARDTYEPLGCARSYCPSPLPPNIRNIKDSVSYIQLVPPFLWAHCDSASFSAHSFSSSSESSFFPVMSAVSISAPSPPSATYQNTSLHPMYYPCTQYFCLRNHPCNHHHYN